MTKTDRETERQRDRETEKQRDRETERQRYRDTERQRDRETERHKDLYQNLKKIDENRKIINCFCNFIQLDFNSCRQKVNIT